MATFMYSAKPLFVSRSLLAISFLKIKIDLNFKNLFSMNFFLKFSNAGQIITKWYSSATHPKSQLYQSVSSLGMPFCLSSSVIKLLFDILNFDNSVLRKKLFIVVNSSCPRTQNITLLCYSQSKNRLHTGRPKKITPVWSSVKCTTKEEFSKLK